ncbi:MAG: ATP-binding cassette domain-containing protein [Holosporales bacterium]
MLIVQTVQISCLNGTMLSVPYFRLTEGQTCLVRGAYGEASFSLLLTLVGLGHVMEGKVNLCGTDVYKLGNADRDKFRALHMGVVAQRRALIASLTVEHNMLLAARAAGKKLTLEAMHRVLAPLNVSHLVNTKAGALDYAQARRVGVARALINSPKVLFLQEPTADMYPYHTYDFMDAVKTIAQKSGTILVVISNDDRLEGRFEQTLTIEGDVL